MIRHLLTGREFDRAALEQLIETTAGLKAGRGKPGQPRPLEGKSIGMIFAKSSTRTRVSFEVGIHELGGQPIYLDESKTQMGRGETIADTARVLSRFLHGIVIRTFRQSDVEGLAQYGSIPIVNALTDDYHPCQAFADLFTIWERKGKLEGLKMAYLGDGASNMANSLMMACKLAGMTFTIGAPEEFRPRQAIMDEDLGPGKVEWTTDPVAAMQDADFVYTDVWVSMGFEKESRERMKILEPYRLDMKMLGHARPDVKVMHCLPAHRGEEITDEVMESEHSIVFDEAENRLHMHKAILCTLFR
jgi:ornithine carbamoyltransferase